MSVESNTIKETGCCPPFNPSLWDYKVVEWDNKKFIRDKVFTAFYMPVNFGGVMKRVMALVDKAGASVQDNMCLSDHTSKWNMDVLVAVDKEVPGAENLTISGKFFCKVYEGSFKETGKWGEDFKREATAQGYEIKKWYMWYTTCPKCAKAYGKNYVVFICKVE